jgi:hypothetical protein
MAILDMVQTTNSTQYQPKIQGDFMMRTFGLCRAISCFRFPSKMIRNVKSIFAYLHIYNTPLSRQLETTAGSNIRQELPIVGEIQKVTKLLLQADGIEKSSKWFREQGNMILRKEMIEYGIDEFLQKHKSVDPITLANYIKWIIREECRGIIFESVQSLLLFVFEYGTDLTENQVDLVRTLLRISPERFVILDCVSRIAHRILREQQADTLTPHGLARVINVVKEAQIDDQLVARDVADTWAKVWGLILANRALFFE